MSFVRRHASRLLVAALCWGGLFVPSVLTSWRFDAAARVALFGWLAALSLGPGIEAVIAGRRTGCSTVGRAVGTSFGVWLGFVALFVFMLGVRARLEADVPMEQRSHCDLGAGIASILLAYSVFVLPLCAMFVAAAGARSGPPPPAPRFSGPPPPAPPSGEGSHGLRPPTT